MSPAPETGSGQRHHDAAALATAAPASVGRVRPRLVAPFLAASDALSMQARLQSMPPSARSWRSSLRCSPSQTPASRQPRRRRQQVISDPHPILCDPVGERRAFELHALAGIDLGLAVERRVVAELGYKHMRQQPRPGSAAPNGQAGCGCLGNGLPEPAGELRPHVAGHAQRGRHIVQDFGGVLAERPQCAAAGWAEAGDLMQDHVARQMRRERPPCCLSVAKLAVGGCWRLCRRRGAALLLQVLKSELQLCDRRVELLRRAAELQLGQLRAQPRDPGLLPIKLGLLAHDGRGLRRDQRAHLVGQREEVHRHLRIMARLAPAV